jgi:hypothetical protein
MVVQYSPAPLVTVVGTASLRRCGSARATRVSTAQTSSGGSLEANVVVTVMECSPGGLLRLTKDAAASTEFGMMCKPPPVSMWVARQLTSTTRPRAEVTSTQSPIRKGCSKSSSRPEMICPTEFCRVRPRTIDVMPSAVNNPPTLAPQM